MKLRDIILPVVLLAMSSCAKQELDGNTNGVPADGVKVNYSLSVATMVETRADDKNTDESQLNSMHVLVFEENQGMADRFVEIKQAMITSEGTIVKLSSSGGARRIVRIVANAAAIIQAAGEDIFKPESNPTWESISKALKVGSINVDDAGAPSSTLPTTPLPMFSEAIPLNKIEPGLTSIGTVAAPVKLKSGYSKVSLACSDTKLVITGVALHNAPAKGYSLFADATTSDVVTERVNYHAATTFMFDKSVNYLFPTKVTEASFVDMIVKGRYGGDSEDTFYRIALSKPQADSTRQRFNFQANYHYAVTITKAGTHGYPSKQQAADSPYSNIIVDIDVSDLGNEVVSNGQYYMSISDLRYEVRGDLDSVKIATLKTDAPSKVERSVKVISGADVISKVELNGDEIRATTKNIKDGRATVRVIVGNLYQDIVITNTDPSVAWPVKVLIEGKVVIDSLFTVGQQVKINAPFREKQKFSKWVTNLTKTYAANFTTPTLTFAMPNYEISLTVEYTSAPYKMTVHKPGRIVNKGSIFEPALVRETDTTYVRYYTLDEFVYIDTPQVPFAGSEFANWSGNHGNFGYYIHPNRGGGGASNLYTYLKMYDTGQVELAATPEYKHGPYWSTEYTENGSIAALFIDRKNPYPGMLTMPAGYAFVRPYTRQEKNIIMRALNTIENTFANRPSRTIKISFGVINVGAGYAGGSTEPSMAEPGSKLYDQPKEKWLATDFGGIAKGMPALSSRFEAVWRDQLKVDPSDAPKDNSFIGYCDGFVGLDNLYIADVCYMGESESAKPPYDTDFETLVLHEVSHIIAYHSTGKRKAGPVNGMTACDVFIADKNNPANNRVVFGNIPEENYAVIFYSELVKSYYGNRYVDFATTDYSHLWTEPYGIAIGAHNQFGPCCRRFPDFELAMLQEMGWKINPKAWKTPPSSKNVPPKR